MEGVPAEAPLGQMGLVAMEGPLIMAAAAAPVMEAAVEMEAVQRADLEERQPAQAAITRRAPVAVRLESGLTAVAEMELLVVVVVAASALAAAVPVVTARNGAPLVQAAAAAVPVTVPTAPAARAVFTVEEAAAVG